MKKVMAFLITFLPIIAFTQKNHAVLMDQYLQAQMKVHNFSGAVLVMQQNKTVLQKGYGLADKEWNIANTPEGKFEIGSMTKQFTAACILQLIEKGKLHFDDKLSRFYPDFPKGDSVTIYMLLNHTSGIPIFTAQPDFSSYERLSLSADSMVNYFKNRSYDFSPGKRFRYNNAGFFLLGHIVEKVTGESLDVYLRKNILDKLGMQHTGSNKLDSILPMRVRGYSKDKNASFISMEWPHGAGYLYSTVEDLYKWDRALYGTAILTNASKQKMFTHGMGNYGFGLFIDSFFHHYRIHHAGGINGFSANMIRFPNDNACVIVLCNNDNIAWTIADGLAAILFNQDYELPVKREAKNIDFLLLKNVIGTYTLATPVLYSKEIALTSKGNHLLLHQADLDIADFPLNFEFIPASEDIFYNEDFLMELQFVRDKNGAIKQAYILGGGVRVKMKKMK